MHKRKGLSVLAVVALALGLFGVIAPPALAQVAPDSANFMPLEQFSDKQALGDHNDGTDELAHLTLVANSNATQASWYYCTAGGNNTGGLIGTADCVEIGTDSAGVTPAGVTDKAFETSWDIPSTDGIGDARVDIVSRTCNGAAGTDEDGNGVPDNCVDNREDSVFVDNGQGFGADQDIPTGEIRAICRETGAGACTDTSDFTTSFHGDTIPVTGFTVSFRTSDGVDGLAYACLESGPDGDTEPAGGTCVNATQGTAGTGFQSWTATFSDAAVSDTAATDYDLSIGAEDDALTTVCEDDVAYSSGQTAAGDICILDEHYVVTVAATTDAVQATWDDDDDDTSDNTCTNPDTADTNVIDTSDEEGVGCLRDSAGNLRDIEATASLVGIGEFTGCDDEDTATGAGTAEDHDGDGLDEHCHYDAGDGGTNDSFEFTVGNPTSGSDATNVAGDQTVTFCADPGQDTPTASTHGCDDATATASLTESWVDQPVDIELAYSGTGDAADPCLNADTFKTNTNGDTDTLVACTYDADGNLSSTTPAGQGELSWEITSENDSVVFNASPPRDTGADGTATVEIRAIDDGSATIKVSATGGGFTGTETSSVTKVVEEGGPPPPPPPTAKCKGVTATHVGTSGADVINGTSGRDVIKAKGGNDLVRGKGGNDLICLNGGKDNGRGGRGKDRIYGGRGNDLTKGGAGADRLFGQRGRDTLRGGGGNDFLNGGPGPDRCFGGRGRDTLVSC